MLHCIQIKWSRTCFALAASLALAALGFADSPKPARKPAKKKPAVKSNANNSKPKYSKFDKAGQRSNLTLTSEKQLGRSITSQELDEIVAGELIESGSDRAESRIGDDVFIRRVYLDVIGRLPAPAEIEEYVASKDPGKKAALIDRLLGEKQYGEHWAHYWRDVVAYRATAGANRQAPFRHFDVWLARRLNDNAPWDSIVRDMLTASGNSDDAPQGFFLGAHEGKPEELAGETARIFLGVQIGCAQCHDHPTDPWLRDQFHELAAFFGKVAVRPRRQQPSKMGGPTVEIFERRVEYRKPNLENPSDSGEITAPVFLTGQAFPMATGDDARRKALATAIVSKKNAYFAKAFVNRIWYELMGQGFTNPIDDLGNERSVALPRTFAALSKSFAASNYDVKRLLKTILNSRVYDRRFQETAESASGVVQNKAIVPTRLSSDQIFDAVDWVLGALDDGKPNAPRRPNARGAFRQVFGFDPSVDKNLVEGSIPQALALMNNPAMQARIAAPQPGSLLDKLLRTQSDDKAIVKMLYLRVLARKPTDEELYRAAFFVAEVGNRAEAFEDLLWALLNSTEFLYKH